MNNFFSSGQIPKTGDFNADFIMRQYKLNKMAKFKEIKSTNPKSNQYEKTRELKFLSSTLRQYRREINMLSPYRIPPSSNTQKYNRRPRYIMSMTSK